MKIITCDEAMRTHRQHSISRLFSFCVGKCRQHGSMDTYTGREVQDTPCVLTVFAKRQRDNSGPHVRLMSVTLNWVWKGVQRSRIIVTARPFLTNFL